MDERALQDRRAIEALRAGVPNRDAVRALGSLQIGIEDRFRTLLHDVASADAGAPKPPGGVLLKGGFGSGKSHVLEHLQHLALEDGYVVSKVVVSKETPLHDPAKMFRAAIAGAKVPHRTGDAVTNLAEALDTDAPAYAEFFKWAHDERSSLNGRFAATLFLHGHLGAGGVELAARIRRFWAGDPLPVPDIRRALKEAGQANEYTLKTSPEKLMAPERFRFIARLVRAAGYRGWVILVDEVELIARYTLLQRARSYAEMASWVEGDRTDPGAPIGAVLATVDDFEAEVLVHRNDMELVPAKIRLRTQPDSDLLAARAEKGMRMIERDCLALQPPDIRELDRTYELIKGLHGTAYGWSPPDVEGVERLPSNRMRQYVRAWINEWDLRRLDPSYTPHTSAEDLGPDLSEDPDLEKEDTTADAAGDSAAQP